MLEKMKIEDKIVFSDDKLVELCRLEAEALHRFIEAWMNASVEKTEAIFSRFSNAMDPDFIIIDPYGRSKTKNEIVDSFWNAFGSQAKSFKILIKNFNQRLVIQNMVIATYEEWQITEKESARLSTIVYKMNPENNKPLWYHLHETWLTDF